MTVEENKTRLTILSITLENFMCHESLKLTFNKPLTCIAGTNGSGKSSVLTALGIILGQRVNSLDRGPNLKSLIMSDKEFFCITLVINNYFKFHEDFFGTNIVLEKYVTNTTIRLKIMNEKKEVFSTRVCDLEDILDLYGLDMGNPINFLSQDNAKKLLRTTKNEQLYTFFEKAIGIDKMTEFHNETKEKVDTMKEKLSEIEKEIRKLEKDFNLQNEKLNFKSKKEALNDKLQNIQSEKNSLFVTINKLKIQEIYSNISQLVNSVKEKRTMIQSLNDKIKNLQDQENKEIAEKNQLAKMNEERIKNYEINIRKLKNEITNLNEKINIKNKMLVKNVVNHKNDKKILTREEIEKRIEEIETEKRNLFLVLREDFKEIDDKIYALRKQVNYISGLKNNRLKYFSDKMTDIIRETERLGIIGPIANYIELKENKWYKAASIVLKNELSNFIVRNKHEREQLNEIFKRYNVNFKIILPSKNSLKEEKTIEYRSNQRYKTLLNILNVKNVLVLNQLIILTNLEQIILIDERHEAHEIIRSKPHFVSCAYLPSGDRISIIENSLSDFRARQNNFYFEGFNLKTYEDELAKVIKEKEKMNTEKLKTKNTLLLLDKEIMELKQPIEEEKEENQDELKEEIIYLTDQRDKLMNRCSEIEEMTNEAMGSAVQSSLSSKKSEIDLERNALNQIDEDIFKLKTRFIDAKNEFYNLNRNYELNIKNTQSQSDINNLFYAAKKWIDNIEVNFNCFASVAEIERNIKQLEKEINLCDYFEENTNIDFKREIKNLEKLKIKYENKITSLNSQIKGMEDIFDENEVLNSISKINKDLKFKNKIAEKYKARIHKLIEGIQERMKKREEMRINIAQEVSDEFNNLTSKRDYEGSIVFDHSSGSLDLKMTVDASKKGSRGTLSGGERSFAGICFILAMYKSSSCLLKCLDEFDVFMDNINRKMAIKLLQEYTLKNPVQVIVVTPLGTKDMFCDFGEVFVLKNTRENIA